MLDGFDFFIIGVANPLIEQDFGTSDAVKGLVSAAAIVGAMLGAALGVFLFPIIQDDLGTNILLFIIAGLCLVAFLVTYLLRIEPKGRSLDEVSGHNAAALKARPTPA